MGFVKIRVTAAEGLTLRGPIGLRLTKEQMRRRRHVLGGRGKSGTVMLDGGQALSFKYGEELAVDPLHKVAAGRVEDLTPPEKEEASGGAGVKADPPSGGTPSDPPAGGVPSDPPSEGGDD